MTQIILVLVTIHIVHLLLPLFLSIQTDGTFQRYWLGIPGLRIAQIRCIMNAVGKSFGESAYICVGTLFRATILVVVCSTNFVSLSLSTI